MKHDAYRIFELIVIKLKFERENTRHCLQALHSIWFCKNDINRNRIGNWEEKNFPLLLL